MKATATNGHAKAETNGHHSAAGTFIYDEPPPKNGSILDTARWAIGCNFWPVPNTPYDDKGNSPGKKPIGGTGWGKTQHDQDFIAATLRKYPNMNLGLGLGYRRGLIDLDIDNPRFAAQVLTRMFPSGEPRTLGYKNLDGRRHRLFQYDLRLADFGQAVIKGEFKSGKLIGNPNYLGLEIRIGASPKAEEQTQSVIPPSLLSNATRRAWNDCGEILPVPDEMLEDLRKYAGGTWAWDRDHVQAALSGQFIDLARSWGIDFTGKVSKGEWHECHAFGRDDNTPSAGVSSSTGAYHDFAEPKTISFFDLAARAKPGEYPDWKAAADQLGAEMLVRPIPLNGRRQGQQPTADGPRTDDAPHTIPIDTGRTENLELTPNEAGDDPHRLARLYRDQRCMYGGELAARFYRDETHRWEEAESRYRTVESSEIRAEISGVAKLEFDRLNLIEQEIHRKENSAKPKPTVRKVTGRLLNDVTLALGSLTLLPSKVEQPAWIGGNEPFPASEVLAARNALVHLPSLVAGKPCSIPPTPQFFSAHALDYSFEPKAPSPEEWLRFLAELWLDDPQSIGTLQEWMGYLLTQDTSQQKIGLLIGPKRSGKGTIARIIRGLIGAANVANPTLSGLGMNFGLAPLLGKSVAIIADARLSGRTDMAAVTERLLAVSGEDGQDIDRKHLPSLNVKLPTRFMVISNELPKLKDASGALVGRMIVWTLTRSFYGKEDVGLTGRLLKELPGILLWAIEGWRRLNERGHFVQPQSSLELVEQMEDLSSPTNAFLRECCNVGPGHSVEPSELFKRWKSWCEGMGRDHHGDTASFGRDLRAAVPGLKTPQKRGENSKRFRIFEGVGLKPPEF